jgi:hypothetical protein
MGIGFVELITSVLIIALIFLVIRALVLWYWRVNVAIDLLTSIDAKLGQLIPKVEPAGLRIAPDFEAWLAGQNRRARDLSADELAEMRQAYEYKRARGEF